MSLVGCSGKESKITTVSMLEGGKTFAVPIGTIADQFVLDKFPDAKIKYYNTALDCALAVKNKKVDALVYDKPLLLNLAAKNEGLTVLPELLFDDYYGFAVQLGNKELKNSIDTVVKDLRANGTYDDMMRRWYPNKGNPGLMPDIKLTGKQTLRFGTNAANEPQAFVDGSQKVVGFDIELATYVAKNLNLQLEVVNMEFGALIPALAAGKVDMIGSGISITAERSKKVLFSESYFNSGIAALVRGDIKTDNFNTLNRLTNSFYSNIILENRYLLILDGLKTTMIITVFASLFGTLLGALICLMRMSKRKLLSTTASLYISLLRGTPILVLLMLIYYVVFAAVNINPVIVAVFAFGLNFAAYVSEMFRTSIENIDKGQEEAGIAGGFTKIQTFLYIILPQALRQVLPVYKGEFISLLKMTSVVGYIAVQDLTKAGDIIRSRTFDAFFPLIMVTVLYLVMAWLLTLALNRIELSVDPKRKRRTGGITR